MKTFRTKTILALAIVALAILAGQAQAAGIPVPTTEPYRIAFITSTNIGAPEEWTIDQYNAHIQGLADAAGMGEVEWFVLGSTADVDARDNTGTNPNDGVGVPIYNMDGTLVALNNADLWDGEIITPIAFDELGNPKSHWPFTGTGRDGTQATANFGPLGQVGGNVNQGQSGVTTNWIHRDWTGDPPATELPLYGISQVVPEPSTFVLTALGLFGMVGFFRRRR